MWSANMARANQNLENLFKLFQMKHSRNHMHIQVLKKKKKYVRPRQ